MLYNNIYLVGTIVSNLNSKSKNTVDHCPHAHTLVGEVVVLTRRLAYKEGEAGTRDESAVVVGSVEGLGTMHARCIIFTFISIEFYYVKFYVN